MPAKITIRLKPEAMAALLEERARRMERGALLRASVSLIAETLLCERLDQVTPPQLQEPTCPAR